MITVDVYGPDFRKTDIAVAEKIFGCTLRKQQGYVGKDPLPGWFIYDYDPPGSGPGKQTYLHLFDSDIAHAWLVVEKMRADGWRLILNSLSTDRWQIEFYRTGGFQADGYLAVLTGCYTGPSVTEGICSAALDALVPKLPGFQAVVE